MTNKQIVELRLVEALLGLIGESAAIRESSDRPDVVLAKDGRWIGVEVTELHPDEDDSGSAVRAAEERAARNDPHVLGFHWGSSSYLEAIEHRLTEKVRLAADYRCEDGGALWLLIACQIPISGRVAATHVIPSWLTRDSLEKFAPVLAASRFERAFIHFVADGAVFCWDSQSGWQLIESPHSAEKQKDYEAQAKSAWEVLDELKEHPVPPHIIARWP